MENNHDIQNSEETTSEEITSKEITSEETTSEENTTDLSENDASSVTENVNESSKATKTSVKIISAIYDYAEIFAISIVAVLLLFTFGVRLCRVDGDSMNKTLLNNEMLIASNFFYTPKQGDIIVFHLSNENYKEPLVKRVIATEGQTVEINLTTGVLKVNGEICPDEHAYLSGGKYDLDITYNKNYVYTSNGNTYFVATVPKGKIFVMGDNRNGSSDSRTSRIGFVDVNTVLGKAVLRISPFTILD